MKSWISSALKNRSPVCNYCNGTGSNFQRWRCMKHLHNLHIILPIHCSQNSYVAPWGEQLAESSRNNTSTGILQSCQSPKLQMLVFILSIALMLFLAAVTHEVHIPSSIQSFLNKGSFVRRNNVIYRWGNIVTYGHQTLHLTSSSWSIILSSPLIWWGVSLLDTTFFYLSIHWLCSNIAFDLLLHSSPSRHEAKRSSIQSATKDGHDIWPWSPWIRTA